MHDTPPDLLPAPKGRGAAINPRNRFENSEVIPDLEHAAPDRRVSTQFYRDSTVSIISTNNSPDIGFSKSINPYRGCEHGCVYCYARPTHEYLGFASGIDFETRIMVKEDATRLLEEALSSPRWKPETLIMSGVTDPYQPVEKKLRITRGCLEVLTRFRNPVSIITKNFLVTRDIDHLGELARYNAACVVLSVTSLKPALARTMEPRTASPRQRLEAVKQLAQAGIPAGVNIAPIIPGLNDEEVPSIIAAARDVGARFVGYTVVRLPWANKDIFLNWLDRCFPSKKDKIISRIRSMRGGKLYNAKWGRRMSGEGMWSEQIKNIFELGCRKARFQNRGPKLTTEHFKPLSGKQLNLFD